MSKLYLLAGKALEFSWGFGLFAALFVITIVTVLGVRF